MKKICFIFLISLIFLLNSISAYASSFNQAYVRLNSLSANAALSGTICTQPSSAGAGTESKILITFPSDFTINTTASNWTTSTSNLPVGATAWPSIGATATSVSNKTVTFSSGDLTSNTLYCFNFTGSSSTTGASGTEKTGTLVSKNSSDTTIDSTTYALSIVSSGNINITANVDPQVSDLPIAIESTTPGSTFPQNSTINYKITYGNSASTSIPLIIQAEWTQGTISGNPSPSVDILDYVAGSASNAYGSTPPVIDTVNRTITWTISSIPASTTGQTVTFSLKTNSSYTGSSLVSFNVLGRSTSGTTVTPDATVTRNYQYSAASVTATPTSSPSTTTLTPTPTISQETLVFKDISIKSVSFKSTAISISTNKPATFTLSYGTAINSLSKSVKTLIFETNSIIDLSDLEPETNYYFKITARDASAKTVTSDIYIFKTALISPIPTIDVQSVIIASNNNILLSPQIKSGNNLKTNAIVMPRQTVFTIQFNLNQEISLKSIQAIVRNKMVLGFNTLDQVTASSNYVNLVETRPGIYTGKIASPDISGKYEVYVRLIDFNGNILEQKILDLSVTNKFKVLVKGQATETPVENARVLLYLYNKTTKTYSVISPQVLPIQNPVYSAPDGRYNIVLPPGRYKAEISAIGYNPQTVEFDIDQFSEDYPIVYLEKNLNMVNITQYYLNVLTDALTEGRDYIRQHAISSRLFDLSTFGAIFIFLIISILSISARTHVGVFYLPYFLIFKLMILFKKHSGRIVFGKVIDGKTKFPISKATINILTTDQTQTLAILKTNKLGEFYFNNPQKQDFKIKVEKQGFETIIFDFINAKITKTPFIIGLGAINQPKQSLLKVIIVYLEDLLGMMMEAFILLGVLFLIYFGFTFGFLRVLPFMIITILNLTLTFTYLYKPRGLEN